MRQVLYWLLEGVSHSFSGVNQRLQRGLQEREKNISLERKREREREKVCVCRERERERERGRELLAPEPGCVGRRCTSVSRPE